MKRYFVVEWAFAGSDEWKPIDLPPFTTGVVAEEYCQRKGRKGFAYRIVELSPARSWSLKSDLDAINDELNAMPWEPPLRKVK